MALLTCQISICHIEYFDLQRWNCNSFQKESVINRGKYDQFARCKHLLSLYGECLQENPPYIPRKFREDKIHVRSQREQENVFNKNMGNLNCEYVLLSSWKVEFGATDEKSDNDI